MTRRCANPRCGVELPDMPPEIDAQVKAEDEAYWQRQGMPLREGETGAMCERCYREFVIWWETRGKFTVQ